MVQSAETFVMKRPCSGWQIHQNIPEYYSFFRPGLKPLIFPFLLLFSHQGYQNCFKSDDKFYKNFKVL